MLDGVNRPHRRHRRLQQLAAFRCRRPGFRQANRVERAKTHLAGFSFEAVPEDPAATASIACDLKPQAAAVAVQSGTELLDGHRGQLVGLALRLALLFGHRPTRSHGYTHEIWTDAGERQWTVVIIA